MRCPEASVIPHTQWTILQLKNHLAYCLSHSCEMRTYGLPSFLVYRHWLDDRLFSAPGSHTQWTIVHHFSHSCEMRAVGICHAPCALPLNLQGESTSSFPLLWEVHRQFI